MYHPWHGVSPSVPGKELPSYFRAVIEIPKGSSNKYELEKATGMLHIDRVLSSAVFYPANYGFIPQTYAEDNDPLDVLVFSQERIPTLCICDARPIGLMTMIDDGDPDHKIIAVLANDPEFAEYQTADEFPQHRLKMMRRFFEDYKTLEGKEVAVDDILPVEKAYEVIEDSLSTYWKYRQRGELIGL